jgi:beta-glucoside kinase
VKVYLGIDIGGTFIKYGIVNSTGNILFKDKVPTDRAKPEAVLNSIVEIINNQKKNYMISGVGLSIPGVITSKNKLITSGAIQNM